MLGNNWSAFCLQKDLATLDAAHKCNRTLCGFWWQNILTGTYRPLASISRSEKQQLWPHITARWAERTAVLEGLPEISPGLRAPPGPGNRGFRASCLITFWKHKGHSFWPRGIPWGSVLQVMGKPQAYKLSGHNPSPFKREDYSKEGLRLELRNRAYHRAKRPENLPNVSGRNHQEHIPLKIFPHQSGNPSDNNSFLGANCKLSFLYVILYFPKHLVAYCLCNIFHSISFDRAPSICFLIMRLLTTRCFASLVLPKHFTLTSITALRNFYSRYLFTQSICPFRLSTTRAEASRPAHGGYW